MIDHISLSVSDLARAAQFYEPVLAALGHKKLVTRKTTIGFGKKYPEFWLNARAGAGPAPETGGAHVALRARDKSAVEAFHAAALSRGGICDGPPGFREQYNPSYFAAFVRDPDGNRIEAVTFVEAQI